MTRKCEDWLTTFGQWTLPRSEAPETYIFWTGLFTLASTVRRHVYVPKEILGSWEAAPNLYILFIAGAGKARKSTTANYTEELLDYVPDLTKSPEIITKESLFTTLTKSPDHSMCVVAPEFGEFMVKSGPEMYSFLTNIYDGKKNLSVSTLSRSLEFAERPCLNLLGATTPEWATANMPESVIGGGFASRVIFIFEEKVRRRKLYYDDVDHKKLEELRKDLLDDLIHISNNIKGPFALANDAKKFMEGWYEINAEGGGVDEYKMAGYFERRPAHIHKLAMLIHLSYSDELVLCKSDFEKAIILIKQIEKKLPQTFKAIGKNPHTLDMDRLLEYIVEKGRVPRAELFAKFYHVATPNMLGELINGLSAMGMVTLIPEDGEIYFQGTNLAKAELRKIGRIIIDD